MQLMWQHIVGKLKAQTFYLEEEHKFLVRVTHIRKRKTLEEKFGALAPPLFGMDSIDSDISLSIAEELAQKLEIN